MGTTSQRWASALTVVLTTLLLAILTTGCSGSSAPKPDVVRITDPSVARSAKATAFITDLYGAPHAAFWRAQSQSRLVAIAQVDCVFGDRPIGRSDLDGDFPGLSPAGIDEFQSFAQRDLC